MVENVYEAFERNKLEDSMSITKKVVILKEYLF